MSSAERPPVWEIPNDTAQAKCKKCGATGLYWIKTAGGKFLLVECTGAGTQRPTTMRPGYGIAHVIKCPKAQAERDEAREARIQQEAERANA